MSDTGGEIIKTSEIVTDTTSEIAYCLGVVKPPLDNNTKSSDATEDASELYKDNSPDVQDAQSQNDLSSPQSAKSLCPSRCSRKSEYSSAFRDDNSSPYDGAGSETMILLNRIPARRINKRLVYAECNQRLKDLDNDDKIDGDESTSSIVSYLSKKIQSVKSDTALSGNVPRKGEKVRKLFTVSGPVESQSTPMDPFLPVRCHEAVERTDLGRLHLLANPFAPAGRNISDMRTVQERTRPKKCIDLFTDENAFKIKCKCSTNSRYELEFVELEELKRGNHGSVYKCLNLINGLIYAVKVKRGYTLETAKNELYAHGVLEHKNIVRNYSSWVEDGSIYIQNEFCNKGNLGSYMKDHPVVGNNARTLLYDLASALRYMHNLHLVHLDVKPENIFVNILAKMDNGSDSNSEDESEVTHVVFKLGNLHLVTRYDKAHNLEESKSNYISRELLNVYRTDLTKCDNFSLALSVYEAAGGGDGELPENSKECSLLRDGILKILPGLSMEMNSLLQSMVQADLTKRPSAAEICKMLAPSQRN